MSLCRRLLVLAAPDALLFTHRLCRPLPAPDHCQTAGNRRQKRQPTAAWQPPKRLRAFAPPLPAHGRATCRCRLLLLPAEFRQPPPSAVSAPLQRRFRAFCRRASRGALFSLCVCRDATGRAFHFSKMSTVVIFYARKNVDSRQCRRPSGKSSVRPRPLATRGGFWQYRQESFFRSVKV